MRLLIGDIVAIRKFSDIHHELTNFADLRSSTCRRLKEEEVLYALLRKISREFSKPHYAGHERLNLFLQDEHIYVSRDEALRELKDLSVTHGFERFCKKEAERELMALAKDLPVGAKTFYGHKDMEPFRPRIDKIVNLLLQTSRQARKADLKFYEDLAMLEQKTQASNVLADIKEGIWRHSEKDN